MAERNRTKNPHAIAEPARGAAERVACRLKPAFNTSMFLDASLRIVPAG